MQVATKSSRASRSPSSSDVISDETKSLPGPGRAQRPELLGMPPSEGLGHQSSDASVAGRLQVDERSPDVFGPVGPLLRIRAQVPLEVDLTGGKPGRETPPQ